MQPNVQRQPQIKILPAISVDERHRVKETDIDDVVKTVKGVLPQHADENINVTITLLEKNLKIMPDAALMKEALTDLVRNAMDAMSGYGKFTLTVSQVNFEIESLLDAGDSLIGACDFISLAGGTDVHVDEKIKEKIFEPFFTTKSAGHGLGLAIGYRIIKRHRDGRTKAESRVGQGIDVNIYLPLTKLEIVNMMSIPAG
jgi:signal transduction histidine kinase